MISPSAEPLVYSWSSTVSRLSGFFYQCYLIPLALSLLVLSLSSADRRSLGRILLQILLTELLAAGLYFLIAPAVGDFVHISAVIQVALMAILVLYAAFLCPMPAQVRVVTVAAVITNVNFAQSISTQIFMPALTMAQSNLLQFLLLAVALGVIYACRPSLTEDRIPTAYWLSMLVIAALSTACLFAIRALGGRNPSPGSGGYWTQALTLSAFFVVDLLICYLYFVLVREHRAAAGMKAMQAKLEQDLEFYRRSEALTREYGSLRHELKNHVSVMESLLREQRYDELERYFRDYAGKIAPKLSEFRCPNRVVTSVITHQMNTALAAGVTLDVIAAVPETIGIADDDLCSLLSNMLDNAVEGCLRAGKNLVRAALHTDKGCLFVTVTNPIGEDVFLENPELLTTKENTSSHGFGIPIIRSIAQRYDGFVTFHGEDGWFTADAMLYMEDEV